MYCSTSMACNTWNLVLFVNKDHRGQVKKTRTIKTPAQKVEECKKFKEKRFAALNKRGSFIKGLEEDIQQVNDPIAERNGIEKASGLETVAEVDTFVHTQTPKLTSKYSLVLPPINQVNASPLGSVANLATPVPPAVSMPPVNAVPNELPIPNPNQFQASSVAHTPTAPVNYTPTPAPAVNLAPTPEVNLKYPTIQQQPYSSIPQNQYPQQFSKDTDYNNETTQFANPRMFRKIISNNQEAERQARVMKIIEAQKRVSVDPLSEFKKQVYQTQRYSKYSRFQYSNINR
jgi:hypothetical protein